MSKKTWFISDLHLGHKNILKLANRPFGDIEHHDDTIIDNYNRLVNDKDDVYILGDISFNQSYENYKRIFGALKGNKYIIVGNHDNKQNLIRCQKEGLVVSVNETKTIQIDNDRIFLSHFPHREWSGFYKGAYSIYGHCVDDKTEILTTDGWKNFSNISKNNKVLNLNLNTGLIEEDVINNIISNSYSGDVYHFKSRGVDLRVTDKHRMLTMTAKKNKFKIMTAKEFAKSGTRYFLRAGDINNKGLNLQDDMLKLLVWISADGSIYNTDLVRLRLYKKRKIDSLTKLLTNMCIDFRVLKQKSGVSINFTLPKELSEYRFKPIDDKILMCNREQAEIIFETYAITDGKKYNKNCVTIFTSKKEEAEILQKMFILNDFGCTLNTRKNQGFELKSGKDKLSYELYVNKKNIRGVSITKSVNVEYVSDEHFWCVNTNNGTIIVRRNGKVVITGNCHGNIDDYKQSTDCGVDCWEYEPVEWTEIKQYIDDNCEPNVE